MSSRKRPARHDLNVPMHWNKAQYVTHLKSMRISVKSCWRLYTIRQLYFVNLRKFKIEHKVVRLFIPNQIFMKCQSLPMIKLPWTLTKTQMKTVQFHV